MELSANPRFGEQDEAPPAPSACLSQMKSSSSSYSTVQQQGYSASIFLRRKDKLERVSQLSGIFLLCSFTVPAQQIQPELLHTDVNVESKFGCKKCNVILEKMN